MLLLQAIPGLPSPPGSAETLLPWLVGSAVLGAGAMFRWFANVMAAKDELLSRGHDRAIAVMVEHTQSNVRLTVAIEQLAQSVAKALTMQDTTASEIRRLVLSIDEQQKVSSRHVEMLEEQNALLNEKLALLRG